MSLDFFFLNIYGLAMMTAPCESPGTAVACCWLFCYFV